MAPTVVTQFDRAANVLHTDDGQTWPIVDLFDARGLPTRNDGEAVICIAGAPGSWLALALKPFDPNGLQ